MLQEVLHLLINDGATFPNLIGKEELNNTGFPTYWIRNFFIFTLYNLGYVYFSLIAVFLTTRTKFGRHIYAIGGNTKAANLSGVNVNGVTLLTYGISGLCAGVVGVIVTSQLISSHPATGTTWELNAIAAVVLGRNIFDGGKRLSWRNNYWSFCNWSFSNGMILEGVSSFWQRVIMGTIIVLAVMIDQLQTKFIQKNQ